jgi:DNA-directed RNA polymerase specialized sigma24 family protein
MDVDVDRVPDEVLLARLGTGDVDSAVAFVRRFQRGVFGVALAITGDLDTAEDVARRAFEHASRHARAYDWQRGSVSTWLTRIARDLGVGVIDARAAAPATPDDLAGLLTAMCRQPDPHEGSAALRGTLDRLPATQARAVAMASIFGLTAQQIADAERIPFGVARTRITDGMRTLCDAQSGSVATAASQTGRERQHELSIGPEEPRTGGRV